MSKLTSRFLFQVAKFFIHAGEVVGGVSQRLHALGAGMACRHAEHPQQLVDLFREAFNAVGLELAVGPPPNTPAPDPLFMQPRGDA